MTTFAIDPDIKNQPGWLWARAWLEQFDLSRLTRLTFTRPIHANRAPVSGTCFMPTKINKTGLFRIVCRQHAVCFPVQVFVYEKPIYRDPLTGLWPPVPADWRVTRWVRNRANGREWWSVISFTTLADLDEAIVFIVGHESFHFLRRTRQVTGINFEHQADKFALGLVEKWRAKYPPTS